MKLTKGDRIRTIAPIYDHPAGLLGRVEEVYPDGMLAFTLDSTPDTILMALAEDWQPALERVESGADADTHHT